jgi:hypothetical protein
MYSRYPPARAQASTPDQDIRGHAIEDRRYDSHFVARLLVATALIDEGYIFFAVRISR